MWELLTEEQEKSCSNENGYDNKMDESKNP
jgi:hypothetical protein